MTPSSFLRNWKNRTLISFFFFFFSVFMEEMKNLNVAEKEFTEIPSLKRVISANNIQGFDGVEETQQCGGVKCSATQLPTERDSVLITMPPFPAEVHLQRIQGVLVNGGRNDFRADFENGCHLPAKFHSQRIEKVSAVEDGLKTRSFRDPTYDSFKTWSGKLEWQLTHLGRKQPSGAELEEAGVSSSGVENIPVERYYDALVGPELETLRDSEEILLPEDQKWPFLLRFPISSFGICLGLSSQAIMWKALANSSAAAFPHLNLKINLLLWSISIALIAIISFTYLLKMIIFFEAVRREYYHPIRINFFFAPWIALLFLALGVPPSIATKLDPALWYILMAPILCLEIKIYGQWMSGGERRLSKVANPSNHLSIVGNFVGALLGASMGLKEGPIFFFAVGIAHYTVLFVTLYQRLPTNETLPKELHPVFFLFVAAPSVASMAWDKMHGSFDYGSRIAYFIAMFLYFSLAVRVNFFRGFKFSLAWWAYTFPMTGAAIATIRYSNEVSNSATRSLSILLSVVATLTVSSLLLSTIIHAFVLRDLFPNDIAIAICKGKPKSHKKWFNLRTGSSQSKDVEKLFKLSCLGVKDLEASTRTSSVES